MDQDHKRKAALIELDPVHRHYCNKSPWHARGSVILDPFYRWRDTAHTMTLYDQITGLQKRAKLTCKPVFEGSSLSMLFATVPSGTMSLSCLHSSLCTAISLRSGRHIVLSRSTHKSRPEMDLWVNIFLFFHPRSWSQENVCECSQSVQDRTQGEANINWTPIKFQVLCCVYLVGYFIQPFRQFY